MGRKGRILGMSLVSDILNTAYILHYVMFILSLFSDNCLETLSLSCLKPCLKARFTEYKNKIEVKNKMDLLQTIETQKTELGAVAPINETSTKNENDQVSEGIKVTPQQIYKALCDTLENVWLALTDNMQRSDLEPEQVAEWVDTLEWAVAVMPSGYERQREIIKAELDRYQTVGESG